MRSLKLACIRDGHSVDVTADPSQGWDEFQKLAASYSFNGDFYNANRDRLLGVNGTWPDLNGRLEAQRRLVHARLMTPGLSCLWYKLRRLS